MSKNALRFLPAAALALALLSTSAEAQQVEMIGMGVHICVNWTDHHRKQDQTVPMMEESWVLGFLSGMGAAGWGRPLAGVTADRVFSWMDGYCLMHPRETMAAAAEAFARENVR